MEKLASVEYDEKYEGKTLEDGIHKINGTLVQVTSDKVGVEVANPTEISNFKIGVGKLVACPPDKPQYGVFEAPLYFEGMDGKYYKHKRDKIVMTRFTDATGKSQLRPAAFPSAKQPTVAHQEVLDVLMSVGWDSAKIHYGSGGNIMMAELRSEFNREAIEMGDVVEFGAMVRNGYDEGVSLGMDLFSYRLNCANGAIARFGEARLAAYNPNFSAVRTSISIRHVGDRQKMIDQFKRGLEQMADASKVLLDLYKRMTQRRLDKRLAEQLAARVPKKYQPDYFTYEETMKEGKKVEEFKLKDTGVRVWDCFNDLTQQVWHTNSLQIQTKSQILRNIHNEIIKAEITPTVV